MCSARLVAALVIAGLAGARLDAQTLSAEDLARRIERRYDQVRDFSADFVHTYVAGVLRQRLVERGTVQVKRPGRMRWVYTSPEDKIFVADGVQLYAYVPADRQVIVNPLPSDDEATTAVLFLAGKGRLTRDFSVRYAEGADAPAGTVALRLDPHRPERDYDWLILVVDQRTLVLRRLVAADRQGGVSTFDFTRVKENVGLPDTLFVFTMPRGVDVIRPNPTAR
jgi:outer membrane lipoprotein carrier protein